MIMETSRPAQSRATAAQFIPDWGQLIAADPVDFADEWVSRKQGDEHNLGAAVTQAP